LGLWLLRLLLWLSAKSARSVSRLLAPPFNLRLLLRPLAHLPFLLLTSLLKYPLVIGFIVPIALHLFLLLTSLFKYPLVIGFIVPVTLHLFLLLAPLFKNPLVIGFIVPVALHLFLLLASLFKYPLVIGFIVPIALHLFLLLASLFKHPLIIGVIVPIGHCPPLLLASLFKHPLVIGVIIPVGHRTPLLWASLFKNPSIIIAAPVIIGIEPPVAISSVIGYIIALVAVKPLYPFRRIAVVIAVHARAVNSHFIIPKPGPTWSRCFPNSIRTNWRPRIPFYITAARTSYKNIPFVPVIIDDGGIVDDGRIALHPYTMVIYAW
jgi:hypothetical protein